MSDWPHGLVQLPALAGSAAELEECGAARDADALGGGIELLGLQIAGPCAALDAVALGGKPSHG